MLELHFLRHGQTPFSRENKFCGSGTDAPLTAEGLDMARAFAEHYAKVPWRAIFHSPLERTRVTAEIAAGPRKIPLRVDERFTEIFYGEWESKTVEEVDRTFHDEHVAWTADPAWYPPSGGEAATSVATRVLAAIQDIRSEYDDGKVLIVSHKATIRIALAALIGIDVGRFRYRLGCPVGSVSIVEFGMHGPMIAQIGNREHLPDPLKSLAGT